MSIFQNNNGPVFLKEDSDFAEFIAKMQELKNRTSDKTLITDIEEQIKYATYGENGEKSVMFELKNSGIDMYILRDVYFEYEDLYAQIDFLLVTKKKVFILECKNIYDNLYIDEQGNFSRGNGRQEPEPIPSPVNQNHRHLNVIKNIRSSTKGNILTKTFFERNFDNNYKSLIVLANDKTKLKVADNAPKDIVSQVIRKDILTRTIIEINKASKDPEYTDSEMRDLAQFFLDASIPNKVDYSDHYKEMIERIEANMAGDTCPKCGGKMILRIAKRGENIGNEFYGCSNYPKCKYIKTLEEVENAKNSNKLGKPHIETREEREKRWENDWL